jgi:hypothetical protein
MVPPLPLHRSPWYNSGSQRFALASRRDADGRAALDQEIDAEGRRAAPLRLKLPFPTVGMVNEGAHQRQMALDLFGRGRPGESHRHSPAV